MRDDLLHYYERELTFLRHTGAGFARKYPKIASRLLLEPNKCDDPHVERLLEAFAFLAARVHLKLDDDFPELSEALLSVVYPHHVRPVPSMAVVEMELDPEQGKATTGLDLPRGSALFSRSAGGTSCRFRTGHDLTLWPVSVAEAGWHAPHDVGVRSSAGDVTDVLRIELRAPEDLTFANLEIERLRFFVSAETGLAVTILELLLNNAVRVLLRDPDRPSSQPVELAADRIRPVGFAEDEGMLPYERRAFPGYRLLQEYFTFPEKFLFFDVTGLGALRGAGFGRRLEMLVLVRPFERQERRAQLEAGITARTFRLGCVPIVNLFERTSEPVRLTRRRHEYLVVADARRRESTGIFSVDGVTAVTPSSRTAITFEPFHSFRHDTEDGDSRTYWYARRRPAEWRTDEGTEVYLSFVDLSARPVDPEFDVVTAKLTCHNGDLPARMPFGAEEGDFELAGGEPVSRISTLVKPTSVLEPPLGKSQLWRLISQFSLNFTSLVEGGAEALQEVLRLHNVADTRSGERQIRGVTGLSSAPAFARIDGMHGVTFARGRRVDLELDEEEFAGGGVFLFASVLERFLGLCVSLNSFSQLALRTRQRKELVREWEPRSGWRAVL